MQCPQCQHENPTGTKFCGECGRRLASVCASCGAVNPPFQMCGPDAGTGLPRRLVSQEVADEH
jgi:hypothetical protein